MTDATNASRTMLFDIRKNDWDDTLLDALNIPRAVLPRVTDTSGVIGMLDPSILGGPSLLRRSAATSTARSSVRAALSRV